MTDEVEEAIEYFTAAPERLACTQHGRVLAGRVAALRTALRSAKSALANSCNCGEQGHPDYCEACEGWGDAERALRP